VQQTSRLDRVRTLAAEDGKREGTHPLIGCNELAEQARVDVRGGEQFADQGERGNSDHDRRAAVDAGRENVLWRVDPTFWPSSMASCFQKLERADLFAEVEEGSTPRFLHRTL
jgi:hypothetical protein